MERLVTLFGGDGFLGRYVVQELVKARVRIRIASRDPRNDFFLRPLAALGQMHSVRADITDPDSVARAVAGAHAVVNFVGLLKGAFDAVHVDGARNVAAASAQAGARALVHVSAVGADLQSPSAYGRSKGEGEAAVRAAFPGATIVRPSILFGRDDQFLGRFAKLARIAPVLPVVRPDARFQPAFVADVAKAIAAAVLDPRAHAGRTYELGGPEIMTMREVNEYVTRTAGRPRPLIDVPDAISGLMAKATGWLPGAPITHDQWLMLGTPNVVADGAHGFEAFGIAPTPLAAVAEPWLVPYRRHGRFAPVPRNDNARA
ncbi:MAG TPA: complex I NDUFA9 subunit family protein [Sphingomonadaceae bacterium]|jgi:NADH dehydrogenase|nr:complex I NDUFA9 subunit family protein [Sphingomonadaceae bacterium]